MSLATTVSLVVIAVMIVVGAIGFVIDRHASKLEP
jgi:preprotein translocase subunit Sss1